MDRIEILSDYSDSSKNSENISSNTSIVSGLSGYQGEFLELKRLIDPTKFVEAPRVNNSTDHSQKNVISYYENRIHNLNTQLQNSLKQNEKYKNDLYDLQRKVDLSHNDKIEKLLRQNNQLEAYLEAANNQIQRLIKIYSIKDNQTDVALLQDKIMYLEKHNHDLQLQNSLLSNQINQCIYQKSEIENECKNLKIELNDLKLELSAKANCVSELKAKISEQHVEHQSVLQNNIKLSHSVESLSHELQYVTKSENWYKEELHQLQKEKINLREEIAEKKMNLVHQDEKLEQLKLELKKWKCTCDEVHLTSLREKENILKQFHIINNQVNNQCKPVDMNSGNDSFNNDVERVTSHYEVTIKDLTDDVARIRSSFEDQQNSLDKLTKENSDLLTKYLSLQNSLKEKESTVERLDNSKRDLKMKLAVVLDKEHAHNTTLLYLRKIISGFKIELCTKNQEKEYIEKSVKTVKEQFKVLKNKYSILKEELNKKNKEILQLQFDKQELYMKNNWKTCELERMKQKDIAISKLQEKMALLLKNENDLKLENCQQIKEIESIIQKNMKLQKNLDELQIKYSTMDQRYEKILSENSREMDRITGLLRIKENIILNLEDNLEALKKELPKQHKNLEKKVYLDDNKKQLIENNLKMQKSLRNFITNNCANISLNNENIEDILEYVCKLCQFVDCINVSSQHDDVIYDNQLGHVKALLSKIDSYFQLINKETKAKDDIIFNLKKNRNILKKYVTNHIERLQDKCKNLQDKNEENTHMLLKLLNQGNSTAHNWNEEIKYLQVQLQVKIREQKDKQKKYETNYRTLLRKVKEHMKGRNLAEKHNLHLQELYNSLSDERNTLQLQIDIKDCEIKKLQSCNEKLKSEIFKFEKKMSLSVHCEKCIELEIIKRHKEDLEELLKNCESNKVEVLNKLRLKEELADVLKKENQELLFKFSVVSSDYNNNIIKMETLNEENKQLSAKVNNYENMLSQEKSFNDHLKAEITAEKENILKVCTDKDHLNKKMEKITEKNSYLQKEVQHLNSCLQQKAEELKELQARKEQLESNWSRKDNDMQNIVTALKTQLHLFKNEMDTIRNDKFFLQRLCNDLKIALKAHVNHNKVLKEYVNNLFKEKECSLSILSDFPSPSRYDDGYINRLLQENRAPLEEKPLSDIQECLDTLRKEIVVLQKEIMEKNILDDN